MMFSYAYDFTPEVEVGSIDEGYFDLRSQKKKPAREIADTIRAAVAQSLRLSASFGIGSNKLVSEVASKLKKPGCFIEVPGGTERDFLIAESTDAKSYGEQETFQEDVTDEAFVLAALRGMADRLMAKVRADDKTVRTITVKLRHNDFSESTRSRSLEEPTDIETDLYSVIAGLMAKAWDRRVSLRLVSLKLSHVYSGVFRHELALTTATNTYQQKKGLVEAIDICALVMAPTRSCEVMTSG
jgi:nucleotidyltransferase/DNA polymerase involved in DNA repair